MRTFTQSTKDRLVKRIAIYAPGIILGKGAVELAVQPFRETIRANGTRGPRLQAVKMQQRLQQQQQQFPYMLINESLHNSATPFRNSAALYIPAEAVNFGGFVLARGYYIIYLYTVGVFPGATFNYTRGAAELYCDCRLI